MYPLPKRKRRKKTERPVLEQPHELSRYIPVCESCTHYFHYFEKCQMEDCYCFEDEAYATLGRYLAYRLIKEMKWYNPVFVARVIDQEIEKLYEEIEELRLLLATSKREDV